MEREGHNIIAGLHTRVAGKRISWTRNRISAMMRSELPLSRWSEGEARQMENDEGNVKCENGEWGERIQIISLPVTKSIRFVPVSWILVSFRGGMERGRNDEVDAKGFAIYVM